KVETCGSPPSPAASARSALVELPLGDPFRDVAAMYRGMFHGRPLVNGYSGYFPPHYAALRFGLGLRDDDVLTQLASHGVQDVVVGSARDGECVWRSYVLSHPGTQTVCSVGGRTLYRLSAPTPDAPVTYAIASAMPLPIAVLHA